MNKLFKLIVLAILLVVNTSISATNYDAPVKSKVVYTDTVTGDTYTITNKKGEKEVYDVFKSKSGAFYIYKKGKDSKKSKVYLPKQVQIQMGREYKK